MKNIKIFCFGFGQVAKSFISKLKFENYNINLSTTSRSETQEKNFDGINYKNYQFIDEKYDNALISKLIDADHILISIPPKYGEDLVVKIFSKFLETSKVKWITYLSATSVYGNHNGRWVNENTYTEPTSENGKKRLRAEQKLKNLNIPLIIFRLSGIYSNENNVLNRLKKNTVRVVEIENQIFSRVHVEDIANILFNSFSLKNILKGEVFNISDNYPCSYKEVVEYGCKLLKVNKPQTISFEELDDNKLKDFYKDSKKVSNKKMKEFFNYTLKFPTYIEGLNYIRNNFI